MPAMFQSVLTPGARERNGRYGGQAFHETHAVPPILSGQLGRTYLREIGACLSALRDREDGSIVKVAKACAETIRSGHRVHAFLIGHFPVHQAGAPGDPGFLHRIKAVSGETPSLDALEQNLKPGDLFFHLGYYRRPHKAYETVRRLGGRIVEVITGTDAPETGDPQPDLVTIPAGPTPTPWSPCPATTSASSPPPASFRRPSTGLSSGPGEEEPGARPGAGPWGEPSPCPARPQAVMP